jgi:membrane protease YdiL (CAAX protease family)
MGFLQFHPEANPLEISLFRVFTAVVGAVIAVGEDMVTRGYVMHELQHFNASGWLQVVGSSLLFALYHSIWHFNLPVFVVSLVYGLILGGLFIMGNRSLTPVILAHSLALLVGEPFLTMSLITAVHRG